MRLFCLFGLHRWPAAPTPYASSFCRCRRCAKPRILRRQTLA